jgi:hypothetical protein
MRRTLSFTAGLGIGAVVVAAVLTGGCAGSTANKRVPVQGKIVFADGTPLPAGTRLLFNPTDGTAGTASGVTKPDGTFDLKHVKGGTGAEVGKYTVTLLAPETDTTGEFYKVVPKAYADGSTLTAEVKEGMAPIEFKIPTLKRK